MTHTFLFTAGHWSGQALVHLAHYLDTLQVNIEWLIDEEKEGVILCQQKVHLLHEEQQTRYHEWKFTRTSETELAVEFQDLELGTLFGRGMVLEDEISWTLNREDGFEGKERYMYHGPSRYLFQAQYGDHSLYNSTIRGMLSFHPQ